MGAAAAETVAVAVVIVTDAVAAARVCCSLAPLMCRGKAAFHVELRRRSPLGD